MTGPCVSCRLAFAPAAAETLNSLYRVFPERLRIMPALRNLSLLIALILSPACRIAGAAEAALEAAVPFTSHMILQRGQPVPVWGFDRPGSKIQVEFAGQKKIVVADEFGDWMVRLEPLQASFESRVMTITNDRDERVVLEDVLVGEVWFSSGQSNMVWTAGSSMCAELAKEIASSADDISIREISIDTVSALYPQKRATTEQGWKTHRDASGFSALSLSFASELYRELNVPIGILLSAHSNTRIEAFTQREAIEKHPLLAADQALIHDADPLLPEGRAAFATYAKDITEWQQEAGIAADRIARIPARPGLPGIAGMWRGPSQFFNGKINPVIPFAIRGAIWCQGTSNSGDGRVYAARMEALVRGWRNAWKMPELPFYFTQMQCYGTPNPDDVGFADIRQAQHLFFMNNRENVGMVVQSDLNSARPQGIHYFNKLHPGMRLARWALAKQYGREIAFTGPVFSAAEIHRNTVVVHFEAASLFGGLMVGSKGMAADYREEGQYVEPAAPTPDQDLNHFRLCGADRIWHPATAVIRGETVVVTSDKVPEPIGVQYAYNSVPENSNLYNKAGLPATPFAVVDGKFIFEEDDLEKAAALKARYAQYTDPDYPVLQVVEYFRDGAVIQRDRVIPIWGHANAGVEVTVRLGEETRTAIANEFQQWSVEFPALPAAVIPIRLEVTSSHGLSRTVSDILVGDVWYLTGSTQLTGEMAYDPRDVNQQEPEAMPLVREFRRKTAASTSATPRKRRFETGGGRYRSSWMAADRWDGGVGVTMFAWHFAKTLNRPGIPQGFITMSSGQGGRAAQMSSPLSWTSFAGVRNVKRSEFQGRIDELMMQYPGSAIARAAASQHLQDVATFVAEVQTVAKSGEDFSARAPLAAPAFPEAGRGSDIKADTIPTYTYNWCVSPMTPMAVSGVVWVPSQYNIGYEPTEYAAELEVLFASLPNTYGQDRVPFFFAQPAASLMEGITMPSLPDASMVEFDEWPKSLQQLAVELGTLAR